MTGKTNFISVDQGSIKELVSTVKKISLIKEEFKGKNR